MKWIAGLGLPLALTACGGGDGALSSTPTPTPSGNSAMPLSKSETFQALAVTHRRSGEGSTLTESATLSGAPPAISVAFDAANGSYTLVDGPISTTFAPTDRTATGVFDTYQRSGSTTSDELKLFNNVRLGAGQSGAPISLTYLTFGKWTHVDTASGETRLSHVLFGIPTKTTDVPRSGTANYQTYVSASMFEGGPAFANQQSELDGTATFSADFGAGTVATGLALTRQGSGLSVGSFAGTGSIATGTTANQFSGTFTSSAANFNGGSFVGGFFGPAAAEAGYTFQLGFFNPDPFAGAAVAPQVTRITGSVVGRKP